MKFNVGRIDQVIRLVIGVATLWFAYTHPTMGVWGLVAYIVGFILVVTGLVRFCPLYTLGRINTNRKNKQS